MIIHGIYLKTRVKGIWHLFSVATTAEAATTELDKVLKEERAKGNDEAEVACQTFESIFNIPELLREVKNQKPLYN